MRLDKYLKISRLIKRRTVANEACDAGRVMINDKVAKASAEMVDFLKLKRFGSLVDDEMDQQVFIMDLSFNPEITDELLVIYFDLNKDIFCITHES